MLIITTIYFAHLESAGESDASATRSANEIIEKKLAEETDANRKLVVVYAGTNRMQGGDS
jgi:sensor domain CHASE-containing protein